MNNTITLAQLFNQRLFQIPDYQRGYSWEGQQVLEFLEDLELLRPERYHYTGTVVLHELDSVSRRMDQYGDTYETVNIVDGQQRLTTIVLLLDGIRRSLADLSEEGRTLSNGIDGNFIKTKGTDAQPIYKLTLNEDTADFFRESVLSDQPGVGGPRITSQKRLEAAKKQIADYISANGGPSGDAAEEWLRDLYRKVSTQLLFTLYEIGDEAEVGVIFEVMNDRGKLLTDLEKVKNFILHTSTTLEVTSHAANDLAKSVNDAWGEILSRLMAADLVSSADEDRLLRAHWLTYYDYRPRQWHGTRSVKEEFHLSKYAGRHSDLLGRLIQYTKRFNESCISFCDVYLPNRTDAFQRFKIDYRARANVIQWSERLKRLGVIAPFLPILIAARERWPDDPIKYLEILKLCEVFAFRVYRLSEYRSNTGQSALIRIGHRLATNELDLDGAIHSIESLLAYYCDRDRFYSLTDPENTDAWRNVYGWGGLRYFMYEYETALAAKKGASPKVSWDELLKLDRKNTIEHILPQSISKQPYWKERFDGPSHRRYVHDLGNLTLTKHNPQLGNKPFPKKKGTPGSKGHCYATAPLYVEQELAAQQDWNAAAINERRGRLLEWARTRWSVDLTGVEHEEPDLDDLVEDELGEE